MAASAVGAVNLVQEVGPGYFLPIQLHAARQPVSRCFHGVPFATMNVLAVKTDHAVTGDSWQKDSAAEEVKLAVVVVVVAWAEMACAVVVEAVLLD